MATNDPSSARAPLRQRLLTARRAWAQTPEAQAAQVQLQAHLSEVLAQLEPHCLGVYWAMQGEFNPMGVATQARQQWGCQLALPYARKTPPEMHFRPWDGLPPAGTDECGIPSPSGLPVVPDVVLVPCLGFTAEGWRLGYGGGYFDRFLAAHPQVTAIGVAWEAGRLGPDVFSPQTHDLPLMAIVTESNI